MIELILKPSCVEEDMHEILVKDHTMSSMMAVCELSELKSYVLFLEKACVQIHQYIRENS